MSGRIDIRRDCPIARLTLSNPGKRNAISAPMWQALAAFARDTAPDRSCRVVVVAGDGDTFSAGADIAGFEAGRSGAGAHAYDDLVEDALRALEAMPQTTIAAVSGPCMGAGAALAAACDFRAAEARAFFAIPAARLGLGYDPRGIKRIVRIFGEPAAHELLQLADRMPAPRAYQLGAVQRLADDGAVLAAADDLAALAISRAPLTIAAAKAAIAEIGGGYEPSDPVRRLANACDLSADYVEGRAAFAAKRPPKFTGE